MKITTRDALIVVDVQKDFCPGGTLPVNEGDAVVPVINVMLPLFEHVFFTRDWHPADHCSFDPAPQFIDGSWPAHCVAGTPGATFHDALTVPERAEVINKGMDAGREAYSGFEGTPLAEALSARGVKRLFVCGLATDYCVKNTALDGLKHGFDVALVEDACRGVDLPPGSCEQALDAMQRAGVTRCASGELE